MAFWNRRRSSEAITAFQGGSRMTPFGAGGTALIVMRIQQPEPERMFKAPAWSLVEAGAGPILGGLYLFVSLPVATGQDAAA